MKSTFNTDQYGPIVEDGAGKFHLNLTVVLTPHGLWTINGKVFHTAPKALAAIAVAFDKMQTKHETMAVRGQAPGRTPEVVLGRAAASREGLATPKAPT
jgi:hypothetical protein